MTIRSSAQSPLKVGKEVVLLEGSLSGTGTKETLISLDADTILISVQASVVTGTLKVDAYTEGTDGVRTNIISFPELTAPTTDLVLRKAAATMQKVYLVVTYSGDSTFHIRGRGTSTGAASFKILGNNDLQMSQMDVTTSAAPLVSAALTDRASVAIKNYSTTLTIFLGGTAAEATPANGWPVGPQEGYVVDVAAGQEIYAVTTSGTADVRISETGG